MKLAENTLWRSQSLCFEKGKEADFEFLRWLNKLWRLCLRYLFKRFEFPKNFNCIISHSNTFNMMCKFKRRPILLSLTSYVANSREKIIQKKRFSKDLLLISIKNSRFSFARHQSLRPCSQSPFMQISYWLIKRRFIFGVLITEPLEWGRDTIYAPTSLFLYLFREKLNCSKKCKIVSVCISVSETRK